jgi:hypothetical protein
VGHNGIPSVNALVDGHHRWQSSLSLGLSKVPCWAIDDTLADMDLKTLLPVPSSQFSNATQLRDLIQSSPSMYTETYKYYRIQVYDTRDYSLLKIYEIARRARAMYQLLRETEGDEAVPGWGVKGTKHVAIHIPNLMGTNELDPSNSLYIDSDGILREREVRLEQVAPRIEWGLWLNAGAEGRLSREIAQIRGSLFYSHDLDRCLLDDEVAERAQPA